MTPNDERVLKALVEADVDYVCDVLGIQTMELLERFPDKVDKFLEGEV